MFRFISVLQRKRRFKKDEEQSLSLFYQYVETIEKMPLFQGKGKKLLLIRLDDIGDYILFRNTLVAYKQSERWKDYTITLLGNSAWKELFDLWDEETIDNVIWINKKEYLHNDAYKRKLWKELRAEGYDTVVCPSCTRQILIDDLCRLATGAQKAIAFSNCTPHKEWKSVSNSLYSEIYQPQTLTHEFFFNQQFVNWCCHVYLQWQQPSVPLHQPAEDKNIVCFIGASAQSKRWIKKRWIQTILLIKKNYPFPIKVIGIMHDKENAITIADKTGSEGVTQTTLTDIVNIAFNAKAIITNDTMMAHLGISCNKPVIIVANGGNCFMRFTNYKEAGIQGVCTVYPAFFNKKRKQFGDEALQNHIASTSDIASIKAEVVFDALQELL